MLVDAELPWSEVGSELAHEVLRLSPFGAGNPQPLFMLRGGVLARVEDVSRRRETAHRRLYVDDRAGHRLDFTWFNAKTLPQVGEVVDAAFHIGINHWKGKERLQLELVDWRPAILAEDDKQVRLFAGQEVVDWRHEEDREKLLADLRVRYGDSLLVWSEGLNVENTVTRAGLVDRHCIALAVLTPPPSPGALVWALGQAEPQILYLLPPHAPPDMTPAELLQRVAGMLRVALCTHDGWIDVLQMAARIAARRETIMAALRGLEASGKIALTYKDGRLRASLQVSGGSIKGQRELKVGEMDSERDALRRAQSSLTYLVRETRAYRQLYSTQPIEMLFPGNKADGEIRS